jgi:hypothetical protein
MGVAASETGVCTGGTSCSIDSAEAADAHRRSKADTSSIHGTLKPGCQPTWLQQRTLFLANNMSMASFALGRFGLVYGAAFDQRRQIAKAQINTRLLGVTAVD